METESWQIRYDMQSRRKTVHLAEPLEMEMGYHDTLKNFWAKHAEESEKDLVYKTRDRNYVELLSFGPMAGFNLPLQPRKDLEDAVLLCDSKHPIKLIAPDGTEYQHSE
jgi:hypothetical protein